MLFSQSTDQIFIQGLGKAGIDDGCAQSFQRQRVSRLEAFPKACAEAQDGDGIAFTDNSSAANFQRRANGG